MWETVMTAGGFGEVVLLLVVSSRAVRGARTLRLEAKCLLGPVPNALCVPPARRTHYSPVYFSVRLTDLFLLDWATSFFIWRPLLSLFYSVTPSNLGFFAFLFFLRKKLSGGVGNRFSVISFHFYPRVLYTLSTPPSA